MNDPVGPACIVGHPGTDGFVNPGADASSGILKGRAQFPYHQGIGNKINGKNQSPGYNRLKPSVFRKTIDHIPKAPYCRKCH